MPVNERLEFLFPDHLPLIQAELERNESFRSLCEDLDLCAEALERWRQSESDVSATRVGEYRKWLIELEQEIKEWLECSGHHPA